MVRAAQGGFKVKAAYTFSTAVGGGKMNQKQPTVPEPVPVLPYPSLRDGVPRRVREEFAAAGKETLLERRCMVALQQHLFGESSAAEGAQAGSGGSEGGRKSVLLDGHAGVGKSVALYAIACRARALGWITVYVPDPVDALLSQGTYRRAATVGGGTSWNTPEAAIRLMAFTYIGNGSEALDRVRTKTEEGRQFGSTLTELIRGAMGPEIAPDSDADRNPEDAVRAAVALRRELDLVEPSEAPGAIVCIDNYSALFGNSEFTESVSLKKRRKIPADELILATAWRTLGKLEHGPVAAATEKGEAEAGERTKGASVVAATSSLHQYIKIGLRENETRFLVPPFCPLEVRTYMARMKGSSAGEEDLDLHDVEESTACKFAASCGGNALALRRQAHHF